MMKLSESDRRKIISLHRKHGIAIKHLAQRFGVSRTWITKILLSAAVALALLFLTASTQAITAPTRVDYQEVSSWAGTGSPRSTAVAVTWQTGDVIVVEAVTEGRGNEIIGAATATGLTFTNVVNHQASSNCALRIDYAIAASSSSGVVSMTVNDAGTAWGFGVYVYRGSDGIGTNASQFTTTRTVSVTPDQVDSAFVWVIGDWSATVAQTLTPTPSDTGERSRTAGSYTRYLAALDDQTSAGATSYGLTGSGGGPWSIGVLEIKGAAGGGGATAPVPTMMTMGVGD